MAHWYTADTHFGHENVMKFCDRPFSSVEEMDAVLIANMCDRVHEDDDLWIIGDSGLAIAASAEQIQTDYGLFSFGVSINEEALSASFDLADVSNGFLADADFGIDFNTNYGSDASLGLNATGQTIHGVNFTLDADLDFEAIDKSNFNVEFSYKF